MCRWYFSYNWIQSCLHILKIQLDPCFFPLACLSLLLLFHWGEKFNQTLAFHVLPDFAACTAIGNSLLIFFLCLSPFIFMTKAENHKQFYVLIYCWLSTSAQHNDIPVVPHFTWKPFLESGIYKRSGFRRAENNIYWVSVSQMIWWLFYTWHLISSA